MEVIFRQPASWVSHPFCHWRGLPQPSPLSWWSLHAVPAPRSSGPCQRLDGEGWERKDQRRAGPEGVGCRGWTVPAQLVNILKQRDIGAQRCRGAKQHGLFPLAYQRGGQGAGLDHPQHRGQNSADGGDFHAFRVARRRQGIVVAEEFVGAVNQIDFQGDSPRSRLQQGLRQHQPRAVAAPARCPGPRCERRARDGAQSCLHLQ